MRQHNIQHVSQNNNFLLSHLKDNNSRNTFSTRQQLSGKREYTFTNTDFENCASVITCNGGAIYCNTGALLIENCCFANCISSNRSGAVFFQCEYICNDTNNYFVNSSCNLYSGTFDDYFATHSIHSSSKYVNSVAKGYFGILNVEATPDAAVSSCIFINGSAIGGCGLLSLTRIQQIATVSNCIFASGKATEYGGAFGTWEPYESTAHPVFSFSFFCDNSCSNQNRGADFDANGTTAQYYSKDRIIHCFSSSSGRRVYIEGKNINDIQNWPEQELIS